MTDSLVSCPHPSHLSADWFLRLHALLVGDLQSQTDRAVDHEAAARQLVGETDADCVLERELAVAAAGRAREAIADIEHALDRLRAGTYGTCEGCHQPIPAERLEAIPHARLCVACPGDRHVSTGPISRPPGG